MCTYVHSKWWLCRAVAIRFGVVMLVVRKQKCNTLGGPRDMLPTKFRGYEIASETIFEPIRCFSEARRQSFREFHMNAILSIGSFTNGVQSSLLIGRKPHPSQANFARLIVTTESCWKTCGTVLSHCLQSSCKFQHGTMCFGALRECPPSNGAIW